MRLPEGPLEPGEERAPPTSRWRVPPRVGVVGCGFVAREYVDSLRLLGIEVTSCADIAPERAQALAADVGLRVDTLDELGSDVDLVLNLTPPQAHAEVTRRMLTAGRSVYSEKPLAATYSEASNLLELASHHDVGLACGPDTFLGARLQEARRVVEQGLIGTPVTAIASVLGHGYESWHPRPESFYIRGGGPLLDLGPYWLTALVHLLGPVASTCGACTTPFPTRTLPADGGGTRTIVVDVPTHALGLLQFTSGATAVLLASFEVWGTQIPALEVHGSEGSICLPEPLYFFEGGVLVRSARSTEWRPLLLRRKAHRERRGIGVLDMTDAMAAGTRPRADPRVAAHLVEVAEATVIASQGRCYMPIVSTCTPPALAPDT